MSGSNTVLSVDALSKRYGNGPPAVNNLSFEVAQGEFFALLGPSGCGKTTTLRMIAGLIQPTAGEIKINDVPMQSIAPHRRPISMVFQSYALFPHMTVAENVAFGPKMRHMSNEEISGIVKLSLEMVRLDGYEHRFPRELSGGQQQRVALARAAAVKPAVLLLDEPLGALDRRLRDRMQVELRQFQRELNVTTIMVTHDQDEALTLSDRIAIMQDGHFRQVGSPTQIYEQPASSFVDTFIGMSNLLDGIVLERRQTNYALRTKGGEIEARCARDWSVGAKVKLAIRPERIRLNGTTGPGQPAVIEHCVYLGRQASYHTRLATGEEIVVTEQIQSETSPRYEEGAAVHLSWSPDDVRVLDE